MPQTDTTPRTVATVNISLNITAVMIDDILCTAFEGGINYWVSSVSVKDEDYHGKEYASQVVSAGGVLLLIEDENDTRHELDAAKLAEGIRLACLQIPKLIPEFSDYENSTGIDAEMADCIVQMAVFGKLVYG